MEITLDTLLNQNELMRQVLGYYADDSNYKGNFPNIMLDKGHNARYVLKQMDGESEEYLKTVIGELKATISEYEEIENDEEKLKNIGNIIKNIEKL